MQQRPKRNELHLFETFRDEELRSVPWMVIIGFVAWWSGCIVTFNITGFGESRSDQKRYE
jgi:hypothetical protein